jgi:hypothetical protein
VAWGGLTNRLTPEESVSGKELSMPDKKFFLSKTFWFNLLALAVAVASGFGFSMFEPDAFIIEYAAAIITVVNIVLRFISKTKITL